MAHHSFKGDNKGHSHERLFSFGFVTDFFFFFKTSLFGERVESFSINVWETHQYTISRFWSIPIRIRDSVETA